MKNAIVILITTGLILASASLSSANRAVNQPGKLDNISKINTEDDLKAAAFEILKNKCNVCHKKQNPFKIFSLKNMDKHAAKINQQVFVYKRMPKGNTIKLTEEESSTLKKWLKSQNL